MIKTSSQVTLVAEDETNGSKCEVLTKSIETAFDPLLITHLDISFVTSCKQEIFKDGCLPEWLLNFQNLEELCCAKVGVVILEPWLLNLPKLKTLNLEQNQIGTWPAFLLESKSIEQVVLDGNPCLEKAFQKSPTLRTLYFSWNVTKASSRNIPYMIRGPEWHIASTARSSSSININNLGFYCGGIYTLATKPDNSNDGFLTPVEPCPIMARQTHQFHEECNLLLPTSNNKRTGPLYNEEGKRQSMIIREIFEDIVFLKNRFQIKRFHGRQQYVLLVGSMQDSFNRLLKGSMERLNLNDMQRFATHLLKEEEVHITQLKIAETEFYYTRKIRNTNVAACLREVFTGFPAMENIHSKAILPALHRFVKAIGFAQHRRRNPHFVVEYSVGSTIVDLCTAFRKLQLALQKYSENLWHSEHHLDLNPPTSLYGNKDFKTYVELQLMRLGGVGGGYMSVSGVTPGVESKLLYSDDGRESLYTQKHILADWLYKQSHKTKKNCKHNCIDFIYLPLMRLVRYERFFTSFTASDRSYQPLLKVLRRLRKMCASKIERSRKHARVNVLSTKFRVSSSYFQRYRWDAVFTLRSRGYLEPGILSLNTNDVIDHDNTSASFVKETFTDSRLRVLRMVACGLEILIWDEVFEHLICKVPLLSIVAIPHTEGIEKGVRILFLNVRETCLVDVKDFQAKYFTRNHPNVEFLEAFSSKPEKKIL